MSGHEINFSEMGDEDTHIYKRFKNTKSAKNFTEDHTNSDKENFDY